jgi:PTS system galactitol-specific IIB component
MKKIVVACGTGGVTSKNIAMKIEKYLKSKGVEASVTTCRVLEVADLVSQVHPDVVCSATELPPLDVPTIRVTAILTGVGTEKVYQQILDRDCGGNLGPKPSYAARPNSLRYCMGDGVSLLWAGKPPGPRASLPT